MSISSRFKEQRQKLGLTQAELADIVGISQQSIQKIEYGRTRTPRRLLELATALKTTPEWLLYGNKYEVRENPPEYRLGSSPVKVKKLPIISYIQAGRWNTPIDRFDINSHHEWEDSHANVSDSAFWLKVTGDSMNAQTGLSVPEGYLILVEPDQVAENDHLVVAKLRGSQEVTFKKLVIDAGQKYLRPLNPNYRTIEINDNCHIIGVVKEARLKL